MPWLGTGCSSYESVMHLFSNGICRQPLIWLAMVKDMSEGGKLTQYTEHDGLESTGVPCCQGLNEDRNDCRPLISQVLRSHSNKRGLRNKNNENILVIFLCESSDMCRWLFSSRTLPDPGPPWTRSWGSSLPSVLQHVNETSSSIGLNSCWNTSGPSS